MKKSEETSKIKTAETWNVKMCECPYCNYDQLAGEQYNMDPHENKCISCGKIFLIGDPE